MNTRVQMLCLWCGPACVVVSSVGFMVLSGLVPPPSPADSADEIHTFYTDDPDRMRAGLFLVMAGGSLMAPFVAAISALMKRVEGAFSPLAYTQLAMGMLNVLLFVLPTMMLQVAAFRPDRPPELAVAMNDLAWLLFIGVVVFAQIENVAIAVCSFIDREERVFPRWLGYVNVWIALLFVPAALIYWFKTGPFAWDGIFTFWIPLIAFFGWFIVMFSVCRHAVRRETALSVA